MIAFSAFGRAAIEALGRAISAAKTQQALAPVTVVVDSPTPGLHLRRTLPLIMRSCGQNHNGLLNVRFMALARVAELLSATELGRKGLRPASRAMKAELVRRCLAERPGVFEPVRSHPSTVQSLLAVFPHLRQALESTTKHLSNASPRAASVVSLFHAYHNSLRELQLYDSVDVLEIATRAVDAGSAALTDIGHVIVYLPPKLNGAQTELLKKLQEREQLSMILGLTGDQEADAEALELGAAFGTSPPAPQTYRPPCPDLLVVAQDSEEEIREVMRQVMARAHSGVPLYRIGVVFRQAEPYAQAIIEAVTSAGIPCNGHSTRRLSESFAGRVLLGALRLEGSRWRRHDVMDWLTCAPIRNPQGDVIEAAAWERLARLAGVVQTKEAWEQKLTAYTRLMRAKSERASPEDDSLTDYARQATYADTLLRFVRNLFENLAMRPQDRWTGYVSVSKQILKDYLCAEQHAGDDWTESEKSALEQTLKALDGLEELEALGDGEVSLETFTQALEQQLSGSSSSEGKYGHGLFIGTLSEAARMDFDCVFIVGMTEGSVPVLSRDNPLIPEHERKEGDGLESLATTIAQERREYLGALAAGAEQVLLTPRVDQGAGRENLPSRWFLDAASEHAQETVTSRDLEALIEEPWFKRLPSFEGSLLREPPSTVQDFDLRSILRHLRSWQECETHFLATDLELAAGFDCEVSRPGASFTKWDGRLTLDENRPQPIEGVLSATTLERYARCPFQFFLQDILHVEETATPEEIDIIDPLVRGTIYHTALQRFFSSNTGRGCDDPWSETDKAQMRSIVEQLLDQTETDGVVSTGPQWTWMREQISEDLMRALDLDSEYRKSERMAPWKFEHSFGRDGSITIQLDDGALKLQGRIDRIDRREDNGHLHIIDYKSGSGQQKRTLCEDLDQGRLLQVALYARVLADIFNVDAEGEYWYLRNDANVKRVRIPATPETQTLLMDILRVVSAGMDNGIFISNPGAPDQGSYVNCANCAFNRVCPSERRRLWQRKKSDEAVKDYANIAEPAVDEVDGEQ